MGIGRMLWRSIGPGRTIDTIKNIIEEGSVVEGIKRTVKRIFMRTILLQVEYISQAVMKGKLKVM